MVKIEVIFISILIALAGLSYSKSNETFALSKEYLSDYNIEVVSALSGSRMQLARRRDTLLYQGFDHYIDDVKSQKKDIGQGIGVRP